MRSLLISCNLFGRACVGELKRSAGLESIVTLPPGALLSVCDAATFDDFGLPISTEFDVDVDVDVVWVLGWPKILAPEFVRGRVAIGSHPSLLPRGRGHAAIPWQILNGEAEGGLTFFRMVEQVDAGPILGQEKFPLPRTSTEYYEKICALAPGMIRELIDRNDFSGKEQDERAATYYPKRVPSDGHILPTMTEGEVDKILRAQTWPYPPAFW